MAELPPNLLGATTETKEPQEENAAFWASSLLGTTLQTKEGTVATADALATRKFVLLYFSAHWCPPCKSFTPVLAESYSEYTGNDLEIIFVSLDKSDSEFNEYFASMPWKAIPYSEGAIREKLQESMGVSGIPNLVILDGSTGEIKSKSGVQTVSQTKDLSVSALAWESGVDDILRQDTSAQMEQTRNTALITLPVSWCGTAVCCFWLPLVCFLAAANVLPMCEMFNEDAPLADLAYFLKVYSLVAVLSGPVIQLLVVLAAYSGKKFCFKYAKSLHAITGGVQIGLIIVGWIVYSSTTDGNCYDGDGDPALDHYINPRTLLFGMLLTQTIGIGLACCCVPVLVCAVVGAKAEK